MERAFAIHERLEKAALNHRLVDVEPACSALRLSSRRQQTDLALAGRTDRSVVPQNEWPIPYARANFSCDHNLEPGRTLGWFLGSWAGTRTQISIHTYTSTSVTYVSIGCYRVQNRQSLWSGRAIHMLFSLHRFTYRVIMHIFLCTIFTVISSHPLP